MADVNKPNIPLSTYYASDVTIYKGNAENPVYAIRGRGRPKNPTNNDINSTTNNNINIQQNNAPPAENSTTNEDINIQQNNTSPAENATADGDHISQNPKMHSSIRRSERKRRQPKKFGN